MEEERGQGHRGPWGGWATAAFTVVIMAVFFISSIAVGIVYLLATAAGGSNGDFWQLTEEAVSDGTLLSIVAILSSIVCVGVMVFFTWLRRGPTVKEYLAIQAVEKKKLLGCLVLGLFFVGASDLITYALGRPVVPEFMLSAYSTAAFKPLFWLGVTVVSPIFEELVFRGFFLTGIRQTRIGAAGAVVVASLLWTLIHLQYGLYELSQIFILGLLLGAVRIRSGSTLPPIGMHILINVIATTETAILL
jgi:hypothetical protein